MIAHRHENLTARRLTILGAAMVALAWLAGPLGAAESTPYFKIKVVDEQTGRGVPLVELRTVHQARYVTDSNGVVAFCDPGLMDTKVFFFVRSHGYDFPKDGFGSAGVALDVKAGGAAQIKIKRRNIAERLYRITGGGIYRDSVLVGETVTTKQPLLNGRVFGQDSVLAVPWQGKIYWFWGDTNRPEYPLGLFQTSGATSLPPGQGGLDPSLGVDLEYFVGKNGFSRAMCPLADPGLVWVDGVLVAPDPAGRERLVAHYTRLKDLGQILEHGLAVFDEKTNTLVKQAEFALADQWRCPRGHPLRMTEGGTDYFLFPAPFATVRARAELKSLGQPAGYEAFTCLTPGTRYEKAATRLDRGPNDKLRYAWKRDTEPLTPAQERDLIAAGKIKAEEAFFQPRDVDGGKTVEMHAGSIQWNAFRKKWIMIAAQHFGTPSFLGEIWFAESDQPTGPWRQCKRIVTHDKYSFYNPVHHPFFDQDGGRLIYFEGTYTATFSGNTDPTPYYDYNQVMYRLDLSDPRLKGK